MLAEGAPPTQQEASSAHVRLELIGATSGSAPMDMVYDVLEAAPSMLQALISLVLLALTLIVAAGILVSIPVAVAFAVYGTLIARRGTHVAQTAAADQESVATPISTARDRRTPTLFASPESENRAA
jgi:hypothetical protein